VASRPAGARKGGTGHAAASGSGRWHLGVGTEASEETKDRYAFPYVPGLRSDAYQHNLIAQAINERFLDLSQMLDAKIAARPQRH
jgi:hypothetical protein